MQMAIHGTSHGDLRHMSCARKKEFDALALQIDYGYLLIISNK